MLLVTGPTGNVGAEVAAALTALGGAAPAHRLAAHHPDGVRRRLGDDVPVVAFDYDDRATWDAALDGIDTLFLLFPVPSPRTVRTRMIPFVDAAVGAGVDHIIYVSVPAAADVKRVPHYHVERHIEASGAHHTFLRCGYFAQNLVRAISTHGTDIVLHDEVFIPGKRSRTNLLDARDVADVVVTIAGDPAAHRDRAYRLNGSDVLDFEEVASTLSDVLERPIRYTDPSLPRYWRRLYRRGVTWDTISFMTIVYSLSRRGSNATEGGELPDLLGRDPRTFRTFATEERWRWDTCAWT
jgi:uncharacterized protein YbjT (DUF2867 family)